MTRRTYTYDRDLDAMVQIRGPGSNVYTPTSVTIIRDIEPYRTAASDMAHDNKRVIIGSRSTHREFLRRNQLVEIGNETPYHPAPPDNSKAERIEAIRRAMGHYGSNTGRDEYGRE